MCLGYIVLYCTYICVRVGATGAVAIGEGFFELVDLFSQLNEPTGYSFSGPLSIFIPISSLHNAFCVTDTNFYFHRRA